MLLNSASSDLCIVHFPKIRPQIVLSPQIGGSKIGGYSVFPNTLEILTILAMAKKWPRANMALYEGLLSKKRFCLIYHHAVQYI